MSENLKISIVIPVYNSEFTIFDLVQRIDNSCKIYDYHLILVDDGSKDSSWEKMIAVKKLYTDKLTVIRLTKNYGQHNALVCGFNYSKSDVLITMDDDLQHPPEEIPKLINRFLETDADIVYGIYKNRQHDILKSTGSFMFRKTSSLLTGANSEGSSFRIIKHQIIDKIINHHQQNFFFIDEIVQWYTSNIETIQVEHTARKAGKSGYSKRKLLNFYFDVVINYSAVPLKLMTIGGVLGSVITFVFGLYFIYKKIFFGVDVEGFTATIVAILFSTSLMLLCFGIIGQYLFRIFQTQNRKPPYSVKHIQ